MFMRNCVCKFVGRSVCACPCVFVNARACVCMSVYECTCECLRANVDCCGKMGVKRILAKSPGRLHRKQCNERNRFFFNNIKDGDIVCAVLSHSMHSH